MKKLNVIIIGAGQIAQTVHVKNYNLHPDFINIVAVVDNTLKRAQSFALEHHIPNAYDDLETCLNNEEVDVASICTPNKFHYQYVMLALQHNIHVLCEKPPAIKASEALEMMQLAQERKCILAYNFHHHFSDEIKKLKEEITLDTIGNIYYAKVKALRRCGVPGWGNFINKEMQGGGPLIDLGIHMLESLVYLLDYPSTYEIKATSFNELGHIKSCGTLGTWDPSKYSVEDAIIAYIKFPNTTVMLETSFILNMKEESIMNIELFGNKAGAQAFPLEIYHDKDGQLEYLYQADIASADRHFKSMDAFIRKLKGEDINLVDGKKGYYIQKLIEDIYNACKRVEE